MGKAWLDKWNSFMNNASLILLAVVLMLLIFMPLLRNEKDISVTFNVTGVTNITNSTVISFGIECTELCNHRFYDSSQKLELCYDQCTKVLGCGVE